jgi:hypothetical protein
MLMTLALVYCAFDIEEVSYKVHDLITNESYEWLRHCPDHTLLEDLIPCSHHLSSGKGEYIKPSRQHSEK